MDALHDAAAVMRSHPAFEAPGRVVDAVRRMLATKATRTKISGAPVDGDCAASALEDTPMSSRCAAD